MQQRGPRVIGIYPHRGRHRVVTRDTDGKRGSRTFATRRAADAYAAERAKEWEGPGEVTVKEAIEGYILSRRRAGAEEITLSTYEKWLRAALPDEAMLLTDITPRWAQERYQALQDSMSVATHRAMLGRLKALMAWAVKQRYLTESAFAKVVPEGKAKRGAESKPQLRADEARVWLAVGLVQAEQHDGALAAVALLLLGCRPGEILGCQVRDLDEGGTVLWVDGKTGQRRIEVPVVLRPLLLARRSGRTLLDPLILTIRQGWSLGVWVRKICDQAGVPRVCPHSLRGLHATLALQAGASGHVVADALGHSERVLRQHYATPESQEQGRQKVVLETLCQDRSPTVPPAPVKSAFSTENLPN